MINLEALKNAHTGVLYQIIKESNNVRLWEVIDTDEKHYYGITKTLDADNSITIIKDKLRMAIRTFNKMKRSDEEC